LRGLELREIRRVQHRRSASLCRLVELARRRHYSTFEYYTDGELEEAIDVFRQRIRLRYARASRIQWREGNALIVLQAAARAPHRSVSGRARQNA
jgi:hypothetical protein